MARIRVTKKRLKLLGTVAAGLVLVGLVSGMGAWMYFSRNLPSVDQIKADGFPIATEVYDEHGEVIGEFYVERRYLLSYDRIPKKMVEAITSAEDSDFFEHGGVDYFGIVRAALKNAEQGEAAQGASTITMQLAKSMLSAEKTYTRKVKQIILAKRLESNFTKQEILYLYLNHVYLGRGAYGVEAAEREYFGKHLDDATVAEMAMLAALPKEPSTFANPAKFDKWKDRQEWILDRMVKLGKITPQDGALEKARAVVIQPRKEPNLETAPYFVEYVRQQLVKAYGDDMVYKGGLRVYTTADARMNRAAMKSLQDGLRGLDKRQGWRGPVKNVAKREDFPAAIAELDGRRGLKKGLALAGGERIQAMVVAVDNGKGHATVAWGADEKTEHATILLRDVSWAHPLDLESKGYEAPTSIGKVLKIGDVVWIQPKTMSDEDVKSKMYDTPSGYATLEQEPVVQGATLAMDPHSGAVKMMVGGYDFSASEYNRAIQAKRQPGSSWKPVIYSAALDKGYTPSTIVVDSPIVYADAAPDPAIANAAAGELEDDNPDNSVWKPKNFGTKYYGDTTFRTGLVLSRNVVTIKILQEIGIDYAAEYAKNLGFVREPAHDLSMALGSSDVSLLELSKIYAVFPNMGKASPEPFFIRRVEARDGTVLEWHAGAADTHLRDAADLVGALGFASSPKPVEPTHYAATVKPETRPRGIDDARDDVLRGKNIPPGYVMDPATAYVMVGLMQDVIRYGTATGANLGRPAAGKTGTTNDAGDTWFMGYTPDLVSGVWIGFDDKKPLGASETGGHTAVPIWTSFMVEAIRGTPAKDFPQPAGIVRLQVDRESGLRACAETEAPVWVAFKEGTEPQDYVCKRGMVPGLPQGNGSTTNGVGTGLPSGLPPD